MQLINVVAALLLWLEVNTQYQIKDLPTIEFVSQEDLQNKTSGEPGTFREAIATYDLEKEVIRLPLNFDINDPFSQSVLLHEMVRDLQKKSGRRYRCLNITGVEAYLLQAKWLEQRGLDGSFHKVLSALVGVCEDDLAR